MVKGGEAGAIVFDTSERNERVGGRDNRVHKRLRMSPAMAAGVAGRLWELADIVALVEAAEGARKRGPYRKRNAT